MHFAPAIRRSFPIVAALLLGVSLSACGSGLSLTQSKARGYEISEDALVQIRPGQSAQLVTAVLGSPQSQGTFGDTTAFYYVETKVDQTAFGLTNVKERTVLAVYFDKNNKVKDKAVYGLQDGKVFDMDTRRTASFGEDRTFIESILKSFTGNE